MSFDIGSLTGQVAIEDQVTDKLTLISENVMKFAEGFAEELGALGPVLGGAAVAVAGLSAAVVSLTITIQELGEKGSTILGVENAFDTLAQRAGTTGDALRTNLSAGVKDTVDQFELMKDTSKLLGAGMKLTGDQALLMGQAARELGKATGTDASQGLEMMSSALVTGRVRGLQQQIGLIDLAAGEKKFAESIGATVDQLNEAGKLEGKRIAILDATRAYLDRIGTSELSFKENIEQAKVAVEEWTDSLAKAVASSPDVNKAFQDMKTAFVNTFGGEAEVIRVKFLQWINDFAKAVSTYGPQIVTTFGDIWAAMKGLVGALSALQSAEMSLVPKWFKDVGTEAMSASVAIQALKNAAGLTDFNQIFLAQFTIPAKQAASSLDDLRIKLEAMMKAGVGHPSGSPSAAPPADNSGFLKDAKDKSGTLDSLLEKGEQAWSKYYEEIDKMAGDELAATLAKDEREYQAQLASLNKIKVVMAAEQAAKDEAINAIDMAYIAKVNEDKLSAEKKFQEAMLSIQTQVDEVAHKIEVGETAATEKADADYLTKKNEGYTQLIQAHVAYTDYVKQQTLSATDYQIYQIQEWERNQLAAYRGTADAYNAFAADVKAKGDATIEVIKKEAAELQKYGALNLMLENLGNIFSNINTQAGQAIQQLAGLGKAFETISQQLSKHAIDVAQATGQKIVAALSTAASIYNELLGGSTNKWAAAGGGALSGAAAGASMGLMFSGGNPVAAGVGAAIGGVTGAVMAYIGAQKKAREANAAASDQISQLQQQLVTQYGSLQNIALMGQVVGVDLRDAWGDQSQAGLKHFQDLMTQFQAKTAALQSALDKYGLTWKDTSKDMQQMAVSKSASDMLSDYKLMIGAGVDSTKAVQGMSASLNQLVIDAATTGSTIPPELEPILEQLTTMGGLTQDAANALLGISDIKLDGGTFDDITAAAGRYGITLDSLGPKVNQLNINKVADQLSKDFKTLTSDGEDVNAVMKGMQKQVQDVVTAAYKFGDTIPDSMKPMIDQMINAGLLTDDLGNKLKDDSGINFTQSLTDQIPNLITAIQHLVDTLVGNNSTSLLGGLKTIGNTVVSPKVKPVYDSSGLPSDYSNRVELNPDGTTTTTGSPTITTPGTTTTSGQTININNNLTVDGDTLAKGTTRAYVVAGLG